MLHLRRILLVAAGVLVALLLCSGIGVWWVGFHDGGLNLDLDPAEIAACEIRMWQAYYAGKPQTIGYEMTILLREQFGLSYKTAALVSLDLTGAAATFALSSGDYERAVLPDLVRGYERLREATDGTWDPRAVAKAELDWWIARRTPGKDSAEQVGRLIARQYALLYGATNPDIDRAGLLRARAGKLRDQHAANPDWPALQRLLEESYSTLMRGVRLT